MPKGRKPKLSALEILDGNPTKRLIRASGLEGLGVPFVPKHLNDDARGCVEVVRQSMPDKVYCALDSFHLAAFAVAWSIHARAAHEVGNPDFEWIEKNSNGTRVPSPWLKILNTQAAILQSLGAALGLSPIARQGLHAPANKSESKFAGLIGREPHLSSNLSKN